jgi:uncharacterized repeat protein (TIGR01451 family)
MKRPLRTLASLASLSTLLVSQPLFLPNPARSQTFVGNVCPPGTNRRSTSLISNGDFSRFPLAGEVAPITGELAATNQARFTSELPYRGDGIYPDDGGVNGVNNRRGGLSIQTGAINPPQAGGVVNGLPFPGDPANNVPPSQTYLYSNPFDDINGVPRAFSPVPNPIPAPPPVVWRQTITGLLPNTTYNFFAYFFDLLVTNQVPGAATPNILLRTIPPLANAPGIARPVAPTPADRQRWVPIQYVFTTGPAQTTGTLEIVDTSQNVFGDDFGVTAIGLRECTPNIGVAKSAGTPIDNGNGTFTIPYTVRVTNLAPVPLPTQPQTTYDLRNLQLTDPLTDLAAKATINSITGIQSPTLAVNPAYSGSGTPTLLLGTDTLTPQTTAVVSFNVILTPGAGPEGFGPFRNTVVGDATTQGGSRVSNRSNDGVNTDPSGTLTGDGDTPTVVQLPPFGGRTGQASLILVKRITNVLRNGSTLGGVNFGGFVDDPGTTDDTNPGWTQLLSTGSPVGVPALDISTPVIPGDEVEYTVYFLSNGTTAALATNLCDLIPAGTSLVPTTTQVQSGITPAASGGTVFTPLAPLPPNNSCLNQNNPNGAVIFNLSDLPNTPAGNVGFVRFRVRIN